MHLPQLYGRIESPLPSNRHAFRTGHSLLTATAEITEIIFESTDVGEVSYICNWIQKAYSAVNIEILLKKSLMIPVQKRNH